MEYYCPKCKSIDVTETCIDFSDPEPVSMDYAPSIGAVSLVMVVNTWEVKCESCGYTVEYKR